MARSFNGAESIIVPSNVAFDAAAASIALWMKTTQATQNVELIGRHDGTGGILASANGVNLIFNNNANNGLITAAAKITSSTWAFNYVASSGVTNDGKWHHVALTYGTANGAPSTLYVDGALVGSASNAGAFVFNNQDVRMGISNDTFWAPYVGSLGEVTWWNANLTADEALALARGAQSTTVRPSALVMALPLRN